MKDLRSRMERAHIHTYHPLPESCVLFLIKNFNDNVIYDMMFLLLIMVMMLMSMVVIMMIIENVQRVHEIHSPCCH